MEESTTTSRTETKSGVLSISINLYRFSGNIEANLQKVGTSTRYSTYTIVPDDLPTIQARSDSGKDSGLYPAGRRPPGYILGERTIFRSYSFSILRIYIGTTIRRSSTITTSRLGSQGRIDFHDHLPRLSTIARDIWTSYRYTKQEATDGFASCLREYS